MTDYLDFSHQPSTEGGTNLEYLDEDARRDFVVDLIEEFGGKVVKETDRGELRHRCTLPFGGHSDGTSITASVNYKTLVFNCLTGDTLVKVRGRGDVPIRELAGQTVELLDGNGQWVMAPVRHYGQDRIHRVVLTRNKVEKVVECTAGHRWYVRPYGSYLTTRARDSLMVRTTTQLRPRMRIPSVWPMNRSSRSLVSPVGVMAGFIYGDGSQTRYSAVANFMGEKDRALEPYFSAFKIREYGPLRRIATGLPRSWKELPRLDEGPSYLYGWLAGYFAADGSVTARGGLPVLSSANRAALEHVHAICDLLGIAAYPITKHARVGYGPGPSDLFQMHFRAKTLSPEFFLLSEHRRRFVAGLDTRRYERTHWWVSRVEETDRVEDVYCAEVPTTQSFVLADNVLTGNCWVCHNAGSLLWWIAANRGEGTEQTTRWLRDHVKVDGDRILDATLLLLEEMLEEIRVGRKAGLAPMSTYDERILLPWTKWKRHLDYLTDPPSQEGRNIPAATLDEFKIGFCDWDPHWKYLDRVMIPVFWEGKLVGWQARRLNEDDPNPAKYLNSPDFPRERVLYGMPDSDWAVVVESPMSKLRHHHHLPVVATLGSAVTAKQRQLLRRYERLVLFPDPDEAGWSAITGTRTQPGLAEELFRYAQVEIVQSPWDVDPADLDDDDMEVLIDEAVLPGLWEPPDPTKLVQYVSKE